MFRRGKTQGDYACGIQLNSDAIHGCSGKCCEKRLFLFAGYVFRK